MKGVNRKSYHERITFNWSGIHFKIMTKVNHPALNNFQIKCQCPVLKEK
jgi:hypothetical protein